MSYIDYQEVKAVIMEAAQEVENLRKQVHTLEAENARLQSLMLKITSGFAYPRFCEHCNGVQIIEEVNLGEDVGYACTGCGNDYSPSPPKETVIYIEETDIPF